MGFEAFPSLGREADTARPALPFEKHLFCWSRVAHPQLALGVFVIIIVIMMMINFFVFIIIGFFVSQKANKPEARATFRDLVGLLACDPMRNKQTVPKSILERDTSHNQTSFAKKRAQKPQPAAQCPRASSPPLGQKSGSGLEDCFRVPKQLAVLEPLQEKPANVP